MNLVHYKHIKNVLKGSGLTQEVLKWQFELGVLKAFQLTAPLLSKFS